MQDITIVGKFCHLPLNTTFIMDESQHYKLGVMKKVIILLLLLISLHLY